MIINRDVLYTKSYVYVFISGIQEHLCNNQMRAKRAGKIEIELSCVNMLCNASEASRIFLNCTVASEASGIFFFNFALFPPILPGLGQIIFSFQKRTNNLFPAFSKSEYLFSKSASPPPLRIKLFSPYLKKTKK